MKAKAYLLIIPVALMFLGISWPHQFRVVAESTHEQYFWWNENWSYRRVLDISGSWSSDYYSPQITITLSVSNFTYSHAKSDGSDLRFTFWNDDYGRESLIPHLIESWDTTGDSVVRLKVPQIPCVVMMYYGNDSPTQIELPPAVNFTKYTTNPVMSSVTGLTVENIVYDEVTNKYWCPYTYAGSVYLAYSTDLETWEKYSATPILSPSVSGWDGDLVFAPHLLKYNELWYLYYSGIWSNDTNAGCIGVAHSTSVTGSYTKYGGNPILRNDTSNDWEKDRVSEQWVFQLENGSWYMFYMGSKVPVNQNEDIGWAKASNPNGTWTKYSGNPCLPRGQGGGQFYSFDYGTIADPIIYNWQGIYYMWYASSPSFSGWQQAYATSTDLKTWTREGITLPKGVSGEPDAICAWRGGIIKVGNYYYASYTGDNGTRYFCMARMPAYGSAFPDELFYDDFDSRCSWENYQKSSVGSHSESISNSKLNLTNTSGYTQLINTKAIATNQKIEVHLQHTTYVGDTNHVFEIGVATNDRTIFVRVFDGQTAGKVSGRERTNYVDICNGGSGWSTWSVLRVNASYSLYTCNSTTKALTGSGQSTENLGGITMNYAQKGYTTITLIDWIKYTITNATTTMTSAEEFHDVAIIKVTPSRTIVGKGCNLGMSVTVINEGDFTETFNVTTYANTTVISTKTVTLTSGNSTTITFTWNTTGVPYGNYTISATATTVLSETDTTDNTLTDGMVIVTILGDVNGDGVVDIFDALSVRGAFGSKPGEPNWNPDTDLNQDEIIDVYDAIMVRAHYGETV